MNPTFAISSGRGLELLSGSSAQQHGLARVEIVQVTGYLQFFINILSQLEGIRSFIELEYSAMTSCKTTAIPHLQHISKNFKGNFCSVFNRLTHQHLTDTVFYLELYKIS